MAITSRKFVTTPGSSFIVATGILRSGILLVIRSGLVYRYRANQADIVEGQQEWYYFTGRIRFPSTMVFAPGETVTVVYRV